MRRLLQVHPEPIGLDERRVLAYPQAVAGELGAGLPQQPPLAMHDVHHGDVAYARGRERLELGRGLPERQLRCVRGDPQKAARRDPGARRYAQQLVREGPPAPELVAEDGPNERDLAHQRDQRANGALVHAPAPGHVAAELRVEPLDAAAQDARGDLSHVGGDQGLEGPAPRSSVLTSSA